jgi:cytochrome P450
MDTITIDSALAGHLMYAYGRSAALFAQLRREDPIHLTRAPGFPPFWAVTRHADVIEVEKRNDVFSSSTIVFLMTLEEEAKTRAETGGKLFHTSALSTLDEPEHKTYRGITQSWFMPANLKKLNEMITLRATELVDKMQEMGGRCDFNNDIAVWFPLRVIMSALGVPAKDHPQMLRLTQQLLAPNDSSVQKDKLASGSTQRGQVVKEFFEYFSAVAANRRANPTDDLASVIANAQVNGAPIGIRQACSYYMILAAAGHDTTSSSLSGGMLTLLQHPEQLALLRAKPELMNSAVEEIFRWVSPVKHFMRAANADYDLQGHSIKKGDYLMLLYESASRDETVFDDPYAFRIDRKPNKQIAFGFGIHACLGQNLARMELKIMIGELLKRLDSIELDGTPTFIESNQITGPKTLPVRYRFKAAA